MLEFKKMFTEAIMLISSSIFISAIDKSPKFRETMIAEKIKICPEVFEFLITFLNLKLIDEIYLKNIDRRTYNSLRRRELKEQEIIIIRYVELYSVYAENIAPLMERVIAIDELYENNINVHFSHEQSLQFLNSIIFSQLDKNYSFYAEED